MSFFKILNSNTKIRFKKTGEKGNLQNTLAETECKTFPMRPTL